MQRPESPNGNSPEHRGRPSYAPDFPASPGVPSLPASVPGTRRELDPVTDDLPYVPDPYPTRRTATLRTNTAGTERPRPRTSQRDQIKIALFGPTTGGKTTFLLGLLAGQPDPERYGWWKAVPPLDSPELASQLWDCISSHRFPTATVGRVVENWVIDGRRLADPSRRRMFGRSEPQSGGSAQFNLHVVDSPGQDFLELSEDVLDVLAEADGLILIFDPTLMMPSEPFGAPQQPKPPTFDYLQKLLPYLARRRLDEGLSADLPQHLAVCLSKFDDVPVYERAQQLRMVDRNEDGQPWVSSGENAEQLFKNLCDHSIEPNDAGVPDLLKRFYPPEQLSYHVVSAIGFFLGPNRKFDDNDYRNVIERDNAPYIRRLAPLHVWEVLIELYDSIVAGRSR